MTNAKKTSGLFLLLALELIIACPGFAATYFVDATGGNDASSGTTTNAAWQTLGKVNGITFSPGDRILFKAGEAWNGTTQLHPSGSGATNNPIVIDMYGSGPKPIINAGSATGKGAVYLSNQSFWEINNLEITSDAGSDGDRRGVDFIATSGTSTHLYLRNCYIHNIRGTFQSTDGGATSPGKRTGGILVEVPSGSASFNDILIENNEIQTVRNEGLVACLGASSAKNVIIRGNVLHDVTKNAMVIRVCDSTCLIEHNLCYNTATLTTGNTMFTAGANGPVFQYNEGYNNLAGDHDGSMYDADLGSKNVVFQYSYSHDNSHGLYWQYASSSADTGMVVRYNISQNDQGNIFSLSGSGGGDTFYNNTIYINPPVVNAVSHYVVDDRSSGHTEYFFNNIFYNLNGSPFHLTSGNTHVFAYNVFYGQHPASEPSDVHKLTSDPMLVAPGTGRTNDFSSLVGFKLQAGSPCIDSGVTVTTALTGNPNAGGLDIFSNTVPFNGATDRGAHEWTGTVSNTPPSISGQPQNQSACQGETVVFSVAVAGSAPLIYQWNNSGGPIAGGTNSDLVLNSVTTGSSGNYFVVITNVSGVVTSSVALLTVSTNVAASIAAQPADQTVTNGAAASFTVVPAGTAPFTFQWQTNGVDKVGATNATLLVSNVSTNDAGTYDVVVANTCGIVISATAVLTITNPVGSIPSITNQPQSQTVLAGANVSFSVGATGPAPLSYQWWKNNSAVVDTTNATYLLSNVSTNDAGNYFVVVTNGFGSVTSSVAVLTVNQNPGGGTTNTLLSHDFSATNGWTLGAGWTLTTTTQLTNSQGVAQGQYANFTPGTAGNYLVSPTVNAATNTGLQLSFFANHNTGFTGNLQVDVSNDGGGTWASLTNISNANIAAGNVLGPVQGPFGPGPSFDNKSQVAVRFSATGTLGTSSPRLRIDNVILTGLSAVIVAPPQITATFATNILPNSVQLNAQVIPGGVPAVTYFIFGTSTNYGNVTATNNLPAGANLFSVSNLIAGLMPGTVYHFQAFASSSAGSTNAADATFATLSISQPRLAAQVLGGGNLQINFSNTPGASFSMLATTNLSLARSNWTALGGVNEIAPGQFQFSEAATNRPARFYQIRSP